MFRLIFTFIFLFIFLTLPAKADVVRKPIRIEFISEIGAVWIQPQYVHFSWRYPVDEKTKKIIGEKYSVHFLWDFVETNKKGIITEIKQIKKTFTFAGKKVEVIVDPVPGNANTNWICGARMGADLTIVVDGETKVKDFTLISNDCMGDHTDVGVTYEIDSDLLIDR